MQIYVYVCKNPVRIDDKKLKDFIKNKHSEDTFLEYKTICQQNISFFCF